MDPSPLFYITVIQFCMIVNTGLYPCPCGVDDEYC